MTKGVHEITYRDAVREAIREALLADPRVFLMGEDVGRYGGCYAVTKGLSTSSVPTASAIRRCPSRPLLGPGSALRLAGCARSSRS